LLEIVDLFSPKKEAFAQVIFPQKLDCFFSYVIARFRCGTIKEKN